MSWVDEDLVGRTVLGRYRIVLPLGRGGQGMVYLARGEGAAGFARPVVVKRILTPFAADPQVLDQFAREARITSQLRHPDIVSVIDFERDGGSYVMVLEYVHGYDLRRWERFVHKIRGRVPADLVAYVIVRVLEALHYAHTLRAADGSPRQVIHRDISPANVLLDVDGHVKLTDFGIARMDAEEVTVVTSGMQIKGKLPYVAPELFRGAPPSVASDVYACGVMLHELLVGKNEFRASNAMETLALAADHVPTRVSTLRDDVSNTYADIVARSLAKDPKKRFSSAQEFARALRDVIGEEGELEARFRSVIREDFMNPALAEYVGAAQLAELDHAWRSADEPRPEAIRSGMTRLSEASTLAENVEGGDTMADVRRARDGTTIAPARTVPMLSWVVAAAVVGALIAVLVVVLGRGTTTPKVVYVQREELPSPESAEESPASAKLAADAASSAKQPAPAQTTPKAELANVGEPARAFGPEARAARLSSAFAKKRPLVERCFAEHRAIVGTRSSVEVQFTIDANGRVTNASVVPDELTRSEFGRCVVRAAVSTRFGPQPGPTAFRIPVTARRVP